MRANAVMLAKTAITAMQKMRMLTASKSAGLTHWPVICGEGADCGDHHTFGALHEAHLAFESEAFGAGTHIADHDRAHEGHESDQSADHVAGLDQVVAETAEGEELAIAVEHRVIHGSEGRGHVAEAGHLAVEHVEEREEDDDHTAPGNERIVHIGSGSGTVAGVDEDSCRGDVAEQAYGGDHVGGDAYADQKAHKGVDDEVYALLEAIAETLECR